RTAHRLGRLPPAPRRAPSRRCDRPDRRRPVRLVRQRRGHPVRPRVARAQPMSGAMQPIASERLPDRPNYLAAISLFLGVFSLFGQIFGACAFWCAPCALALPTGFALLTGWFGLRQARANGSNETIALLGLACGWSSVAIGFMWIVITVFYALMMVVIAML